MSDTLNPLMLEAKIGSFYTTFLHCKDSGNSQEKRAFKKLEAVLNEFSQRHDLRTPDAIVNQPIEGNPASVTISTGTELMKEIIDFQIIISRFFRKKEDEDFLIQVHNLCCNQLPLGIPA